MVKITLDNGDIIPLEKFDSAILIPIEHTNGADTEGINLQGINSNGTYVVVHDQSSPEAIRTIEFLP